jgi:hypothetical protein
MLVGFTVTGCGSPAQQLEQHQEKLASLRSSRAAIVEAWLAGSVSGTYAATALEQTLQLVEHERRAFATEPDLLIDRSAGHAAVAIGRVSLPPARRHDS